MVSNDLSNKTVVVVLVLVMLVSVLSLAISMNAVKRVGSLAQTANEVAASVIAKNQAKTSGAVEPLPPPQVASGTAKGTITVVPPPRKQ